MKKVIFVSLITVMIISLAMFGFVSCGNNRTGQTQITTTDDKTGGVLRIVTGQNPAVVGYPPEVTTNAHIQYLRCAYESLLFFDEEGRLIPQLAESWEVDAENAVITFKLRTGVKFSDGTDFNAEAVRFNIRLYQERGRTEVANIDSVECPDNYTVVVNLRSWVSSSLELIGFFVYYMSPTAFQANGIEWARANSAGTGPFVVDRFQQGVSVGYVKNDLYREEGRPYLDAIQYTIIAEPATIINAFLANEADMISYANLDQRREVASISNVQIVTNRNGVGAEAMGIIPSSADPGSPFYDARVRRAFRYAIDTDTIVRALGFGMHTRTNQWASPDSLTFNPNVSWYTYNPERARQLLAEAGFANGFNTVFYTGAAMETWATAVSANLEAVGIRAAIEIIDGPRGNDIMANGWEGIYYHFNSVGPDLGLFMGRHLDPDGAFYAAGIQHPEDSLDLLRRIREARDTETKLRLEHEMQTLIYDVYALFGEPLYMNTVHIIKYDYVQDDNFTIYHAAAWTPAIVWLNR